VPTPERVSLITVGTSGIDFKTVRRLAKDDRLTLPKRTRWLTLRPTRCGKPTRAREAVSGGGRHVRSRLRQACCEKGAEHGV
jgi:hypothetical protein